MGRKLRVVAVALLLFSPALSSDDSGPAAGILDISTYGWQFHWNKLYAPSDFTTLKPKPDLVLPRLDIWNGIHIGKEKLGSFGFATYRLVMNNLPFSGQLALRLPPPLSASRVFINGRLYGGTGNITTTEKDFQGTRESVLIYFWDDSPENLEIVIQVSNFSAYKGGLRTPALLGPARAVRADLLKLMGFDLISVGVIFAIMLYHFLLFVLTRKNISNLFFAVLGLNYFFLAFLFGEQSVNIFLPVLPMELHMRSASFFIYTLPPLVLLFTMRLYPGYLKQVWGNSFAGLALIMMVLLLFPVRLIGFWNVFYYGAAGMIGAALSFRIALKATIDRKAGAGYLLSGLIFLILLTVYSVYLNISNRVAGSFLSVGFAIFAVFQSAALAREHAFLERRSRAMEIRLETSRIVFEDQRRKIQANLHDSIGGALTDLKLGLTALVSGKIRPAFRNKIRLLEKVVDGATKSMRTELLFLEDLELTIRDFISGINLILLRRYQMAKRAVDIQISSESREAALRAEEAGIFPENVKLDLLLAVQELCTNNLKYGTKTANWKISFSGRMLIIALAGQSGRQVSRGGSGQKNIRDRLDKIGAVFREESGSGSYAAEIRLQL